MSELDQERLDRQVRIVAAFSRLIFGLLIIWGAVAQMVKVAELEAKVARHEVKLTAI